MPAPSPADDPRLLRITPGDNVAVAIAALEAGQTVSIGGNQVVLNHAIPLGHKVALAPIPAGAKVLKYGAPIGSATRAIRVGEHVHTHNLKSDYLPSGE